MMPLMVSYMEHIILIVLLSANKFPIIPLLFCQTTTAAILYTEEESERINEIETLFSEKFPASKKGEYYESIDVLRQDFKALSEQCGFGVSTMSSSFRCLGYEEPTRNISRRLKSDTSPSKKRVHKNIRCGCSFILKFSKRRSEPQKPGDAPKGSVKITQFCYFHSSGCRPGASELTARKLSSGEYVRKKLIIQKLGTLIEFEEQGTFLNAKAMRKYIRPLLPNRVGIDAKFIANLRLKVKAFVKKRNMSNEENGANYTILDSEMASMLSPTEGLLGMGMDCKYFFLVLCISLN
jgi:hypothetical protein